MLDATQETDNRLIRDGQPVIQFDADAKNRLEFEIKENGLIYEVAHIFNPLEDARYLQWISEFKIKGDEDNVDEHSREASIRLWDDIIERVDNVEFESPEAWKSTIPDKEKIDSVSSFLAVAIVDGEERAEIKLRRGGVNPDQTVITEAWFNGEVSQQKHTLAAPSLELQKKYARIQGKRFKQQKIGGLRGKPKLEFLPQDSRIAELYDEMVISTEGFVNNKIPLRFKSSVIHAVFSSTLDVKNLGK
jgi:hypothetical protein